MEQQGAVRRRAAQMFTKFKCRYRIWVRYVLKVNVSRPLNKLDKGEKSELDMKTRHCFRGLCSFQELKWTNCENTQGENFPGNTLFTFYYEACSALTSSWKCDEERQPSFLVFLNINISLKYFVEWWNTQQQPEWAVRWRAFFRSLASYLNPKYLSLYIYTHTHTHTYD